MLADIVTFGPEALLQTLGFLHPNGLAHAGAGANIVEAGSLIFLITGIYGFIRFSCKILIVNGEVKDANERQFNR